MVMAIISRLQPSLSLATKPPAHLVHCLAQQIPHLCPQGMSGISHCYLHLTETLPEAEEAANEDTSANCASESPTSPTSAPSPFQLLCLNSFHLVVPLHLCYELQSLGKKLSVVNFLSLLKILQLILYI